MWFNCLKKSATIIEGPSKVSTGLRLSLCHVCTMHEGGYGAGFLRSCPGLSGSVKVFAARSYLSKYFY